MNNYIHQIRQLIQIHADSAKAIHPDTIATQLNCPFTVVEDELFRLEEEGTILPVYEMRCYVCDEVIAISERPFDLTGQVECPGCNCQMESASMNPVINAYVRLDVDKALSTLPNPFMVNHRC